MIATDAVTTAARPGHRGTPARATTPLPIVPVSVATVAMGGRLAVHLEPAGDEGRARRDGTRALARVGRWADRLSRHLPASELSLLNADARPDVMVRPTLAAALCAGMASGEAADGLVDITLLEARLAAEGLAIETCPRESRDWSMERGPRGTATVRRSPGVGFDLGGVAKGWLADRALDLLASWPSAVVDADGDLAVRCAPGKLWAIAVDDPRSDGALLAILHLSAPGGGRGERWGVATSGTSVHRWDHGDGPRHHLIDPRTAAPAVTDVVQATVVSGSALRSEALAKAAVIAGSIEGLSILERARVPGALVLTDRGEALALPSTLALLAG